MMRLISFVTALGLAATSLRSSIAFAGETIPLPQYPVEDACEKGYNAFVGDLKKHGLNEQNPQDASLFSKSEYTQKCVADWPRQSQQILNIWYKTSTEIQSKCTKEVATCPSQDYGLLYLCIVESAKNPDTDVLGCNH